MARDGSRWGPTAGDGQPLHQRSTRRGQPSPSPHPCGVREEGRGGGGGRAPARQGPVASQISSRRRSSSEERGDREEGGGGVGRGRARDFARSARSFFCCWKNAEAGFGIAEKKFRVSMYTWARPKFRAPTEQQAARISLLAFRNKLFHRWVKIEKKLITGKVHRKIARFAASGIRT